MPFSAIYVENALAERSSSTLAYEGKADLITERRLDFESGGAQPICRNIQGVFRVGIEATGPIHWFERLLSELGHALWIGDSARICASEVRQQKTDQSAVPMYSADDCPQFND